MLPGIRNESQEKTKLEAARTQCLDYVTSANENSDHDEWSPGNGLNLLGGKTSLELPGELNYLGNDYKITLYVDTDNSDSGIVLYEAELVEGSLEKAGDVLEEVLRNGPFLPRGGPRQPHEDEF